MRAIHQYAIIHRCRNLWVFYLMAAVFNFSLFLVYHSVNGQIIAIYPCLRWLICDFMSYDQGCKPSSLEIATLEGSLLP